MIQIEQVKEQLQEKKRELLESKKQNTKVINDITDLGEHESELKKKLDSTNKQLFVNISLFRKITMFQRKMNLTSKDKI